MSALFTPLIFKRGPSMKNRFMLAPLTNSQSHDNGVLSDEELEQGFILTCISKPDSEEITIDFDDI